MKQALYLAILVGAAFTILAPLTSNIHPIDMEVLGIMLWMVSPYLYLAVMSKFVSKNGAVFAVLVLALIVGIFGIWAIVDPIVLKVEANRVSFIYPPGWQWILLLTATTPVYFLNKDRNA